MKKAILLFVLLAAFSVTETRAQHFITSVGVTLGWNVPYAVLGAIEYDYYGYELVHAHRDYNHGRRVFNLVLRGPRGFLRINIGHHGHIYETTYYRTNPLHGHICGAYCGYHETYYAAHFRPVHKYRTYAYNHHGHRNNGHHYGHYKSKKYAYRDDRGHHSSKYGRGSSRNGHDNGHNGRKRGR